MSDEQASLKEKQEQHKKRMLEQAQKTKDFGQKLGDLGIQSLSLKMSPIKEKPVEELTSDEVDMLDLWQQTQQASQLGDDKKVVKLVKKLVTKLKD